MQLRGARSRVAVLRFIVQHSGCSAADAGRGVGKTAVHAFLHVRALEDEGWITSRPVGRRRELRATANAKRLLASPEPERAWFTPNGNRRRILAAIRADSGIGILELARALQLPASTVRYHIRTTPEVRRQKDPHHANRKPLSLQGTKRPSRLPPKWEPLLRELRQPRQYADLKAWALRHGVKPTTLQARLARLVQAGFAVRLQPGRYAKAEGRRK